MTMSNVHTTYTNRELAYHVVFFAWPGFRFNKISCRLVLTVTTCRFHRKTNSEVSLHSAILLFLLRYYSREQQKSKPRPNLHLIYLLRVVVFPFSNPQQTTPEGNAYHQEFSRPSCPVTLLFVYHYLLISEGTSNKFTCQFAPHSVRDALLSILHLA